MKKIGVILSALLLSSSLAFGQSAPPVLPLVSNNSAAYAPISTANPMPVTSSGGGTGNVNLTQIGGNNVVTGGLNGSLGVGGLAATGAALTGNPILIGGSDGTDVRNLATDTTGHLILGAGASGIGSVSITGSLPAGTNAIGYVSNDPCAQAVKSNVAIATSSGNVQLVAPVAAKKVYICSLVTVGATASVQSIIEGTGGACTTSAEAAVIGSTTSASGMSFAANGGFAYGNGGATVGVTATLANGICLLQTGTAAIAGNMTYVQQ
jgi:hypothetical protein